VRKFILNETEKAYIEKGIMPIDMVYQRVLERILRR
jgi:hypothetical protein